ncbi:MAG: hypothetical protein KA123_03270 [Candidatus Eisenbacteria bacterium]|nr:hypothetical protein [Candidatus Eisenbacteria bacterium]
MGRRVDMARAQRASRQWFLGILLLAVGLLTALSLPGLGLARDMGPFGRNWVDLWARTFGHAAVWAIAALAILWSTALLVPWRRPFLGRMTLLLAPVLIVWDAFLQGFAAEDPDLLLRHGLLGHHLRSAFLAFFGGSKPHAAVALAALTAVSTTCFARWALPKPLADGVAAFLGFFARALGALFRLIGIALVRLGASVARSAGEWQARRQERAAARAAARDEERSEEDGDDLDEAEEIWEDPEVEEAPRKRAKAAPARPPLSQGEGAAPAIPALTGEEGPLAGDALSDTGRASGKKRARARDQGPGGDPEVSSRPPRVRARTGVPSAASGGEDIPEAREGPAVALLELLEERSDEGSGIDQEEIDRTAALIRQTLASFGISGEVGEVHPGPVITRYEFSPGPGVTVSQISSRQDDLALALRTPRVRLLAPIPGKAAVGIEIPNRVPALISFREIAARKEFRDAREPLCVALGRDVAGRPFYASLEKMPHLLVAGTTGSGKSVCINSLIVSLLLRCSPEKLRLFLIDPKMLELTTYNEIPHLLRPVVTDAREAARGLQWLTREMERRYRVMAGLGVRNIESYLKRREEGRDDPPLGAMPYIVVCVDELADLMLSSPAEIEVPIARLAQMARAVGIHLVLATQRPSVDVITGVIKANFPARIAFQVATRTDSRTILDMNGAESLIGRGDMLFIPPGKAQAHRVHGAFLSDAETERVAAYLRQFPPAEELCPTTGSEAEEGAEGDIEDPLYNEALRIVVTTRQGSTSMLQRRLRVGYTRAGRLMDLLERSGIVGPPDGSRAREVLVSPEYLQEVGKGGGVKTG